MKRKLLFLVLLFLGTCPIALAGPDQAQHSKPKKNQVTIQGCLGRMSGDYLLFQSDPGDSFILEASHKIRLKNYLGQQVEVTGLEWPTLSSSMNFSVRRAGSPVTIAVQSINTVAQQCTNN